MIRQSYVTVVQALLGGDCNLRWLTIIQEEEGNKRLDPTPLSNPTLNPNTLSDQTFADHEQLNENTDERRQTKYPPSIGETLEKAMATHSSTLAWKIPWMEEPGRLQSMGSQRAGHDWVTSLHLIVDILNIQHNLL